MHQPVDLPVGRGDLGLQGGLFVRFAGGGQLHVQRQQLLESDQAVVAGLPGFAVED
jgi:hypothetical protein